MIFFSFLMCVYVLYFSNSLSSVQVTENLFHFSSFLASRRRSLRTSLFFLRRITKSPSTFFLFSLFSRLFGRKKASRIFQFETRRKRKSSVLQWKIFFFTSKNYFISIFLMYRLLFLLLVFFISFTSIFF